MNANGSSGESRADCSNASSPSSGLAEIDEPVAAAHPRPGVVGVEAQRTLGEGDRLLHIAAQLHHRRGKCGQRGGIVADRLRRNLDQTLAFGALGRNVDRPVVGHLLAMRPGAECSGQPVVRLELQGLAEKLDRLADSRPCGAPTDGAGRASRDRRRPASRAACCAHARPRRGGSTAGWRSPLRRRPCPAGRTDRRQRRRPWSTRCDCRYRSRPAAW